MEWWELYLIIGVVVAIVVGLVLFLRKRIKKRMSDQQSMVNQHKVTTSILVLEKRRDRIQNANMPKSVKEKVPSVYKLKKLPLVKAKIGAQVMDLICDEAVFKKIPDKKTIRIELAGIFISGIKPGKR